MSDPAFQRARRPEQIEQRRRSIVAAAEHLLAKHRVDEITLTAIADRVDLSKSNVYRYFESREEILLAILRGDVAAWVDEVGGGLIGLGDRGGPSAAARVITAAFVRRPRLCELVSVSARVLEPNVSRPAELEFRTASDAATLEAADGLHCAVPAVARDRCEWAVRTMFAVVTGLWPRTSRSPPGRTLRSSFADDLERSVRGLLYGLQVEAWRASGRPVDPT
jgi:AcrR family transcriptional regulator